jgi:hypothetical protein
MKKSKQNSGTTDLITGKREVGRPRIELSEDDWAKVDRYLQAQCDGSVIARFFGMSPDSLRDKIVERYGKSLSISNFSEYQALKRREGIELIRAKQFDILMSGNVTMSIWLGKQLLGQRDQIEQTITVPQVHITPLTEQEQMEISTAMIAIENHESNTNLHSEPEGGSVE